MNNSTFLDKAFQTREPKIIYGFSRPLYHNIVGMLYGHRFDKSQYGGMIRHTEAAMLYLWARALPQNSVIVEIGCYAGLSTSYIATGCKYNNSKVYGIDPFNSDIGKQAELTDKAVSLENKPSVKSVMERIRATGLEAHVELIEGFAEEIAKTWKRQVNFLWIDGNHERAYQDYMDWAPFLAPHARVAFHDAHPRYGWQKVADDVRKVFSNDDEWGQLEHIKGIVSAVRKH